MLKMAVEIYRREFVPSDVLDSPYVIVCVNAVVADSDEEANFEASTLKQLFLNLVRGTPKPVQPPVADMETLWQPHEKLSAMQMMSASLIGDKNSVHRQFVDLQTQVNADELMLTNYIYEVDKQYRSYRLFKEMIEGV